MTRDQLQELAVRQQPLIEDHREELAVHQQSQLQELAVHQHHTIPQGL